ncbi:MAG: UbiA family prenyltransferase, partial [Candidatus Micrarchaeota archaeon]
DIVSNKQRPLPSGSLTHSELSFIACIALLLSFFASLTANFPMFFFILACAALGLIYSVPPIRLRRFPFSTSIIALGSLMAIMVGASAISPRPFSHIDFSLAIALFISITLGANFKDLKDLSADEKNGVRSAITLFGKGNERVAAALFLFLAFVLFSVLALPGVFVFSVFLGAVAALSVLKLKNPEPFVFAAYFLLVIFIIADPISLAYLAPAP